MKSIKNLALLVVASAAPLCALALPAFSVYDSFSSVASTPSAALWTTIGSGVLPTQSGGNAVFGGADNEVVALRSTATFSYGTFRFVVSGFGGGTGHVMGVDSQSSNIFNAGDAIWVRDDGGSLSYANGISSGIGPVGFPPSSLPATFDIEWTVNSIRVLRDGVLQIQSSVFIPNEPLHFEIVTYKNSGSVATMSIDEVLFRPAADLVTNDVPEPSSDLLFGIGLVALWFGRKGRTPQARGQQQH